MRRPDIAQIVERSCEWREDKECLGCLIAGGSLISPFDGLSDFPYRYRPWLAAGCPASGGVSEASRFASLSRANRDGSLTFGAAAGPGLSLSSRHSA